MNPADFDQPRYARYSACCACLSVPRLQREMSRYLPLFHCFPMGFGSGSLTTRPEFVHAAPDEVRYGEELSYFNPGKDPEMADRRHAHAGDATTLRTLRIPTE